jgi:hypothetical protein
MENTLEGTVDAPPAEQSAVQNGRNATATLKLLLLWLAVSIPMLWGMMKALEDVPALISLFP